MAALCQRMSSRGKEPPLGTDFQKPPKNNCCPEHHTERRLVEWMCRPRSVSKAAGMAVAVVLALAQAWCVDSIHENLLWFAKLMEVEHECGLYYSYDKQMLKAPSIGQGTFNQFILLLQTLALFSLDSVDIIPARQFNQFILLLQTLALFSLDSVDIIPARQEGPEKTREDQRGPERTREVQRAPERTREDQGGPERTREDQRGPERSRENQRGPERTREDQGVPGRSR
ncbi:hypothetical protein NHX12_006283 [Muraenolepis orangiensis]|uniref:Uncharacterized protein n=1 Tax=Muraenolepis orangiensis TaxID=630683 RepID=A0A9Q0ICY1_9TELE|nr:hypothetical protein NHX12_006283 [Muraenolepis orangiensis]